jgi:hypothetical protein
LTATGVQGTEFTAVLKLIPAKHTSHRESLERVPRTNPSPAEQEDIEWPTQTRRDDAPSIEYVPWSHRRQDASLLPLPATNFISAAHLMLSEWAAQAPLSLLAEKVPGAHVVQTASEVRVAFFKPWPFGHLVVLTPLHAVALLVPAFHVE